MSIDTSGDKFSSRPSERKVTFFGDLAHLTEAEYWKPPLSVRMACFQFMNL